MCGSWVFFLLFMKLNFGHLASQIMLCEVIKYLCCAGTVTLKTVSQKEHKSRPLICNTKFLLFVTCIFPLPLGEQDRIYIHHHIMFMYNVDAQYIGSTHGINRTYQLISIHTCIIKGTILLIGTR